MGDTSSSKTSTRMKANPRRRANGRAAGALITAIIAANRRETGKQLREASKLMRKASKLVRGILSATQGFTDEEEPAQQAFDTCAQSALANITAAIDVNQYGMAYVESLDSKDEIVDPEPAGTELV